MIRCARYALPVLLVAALAGCAAPAAPTVAPAAAGLSADEAAFVQQARQIAPSLTGSDERIARRGANTCDGLREGRPSATLAAEARERFSPDQVSSVQAGRLVEAARVTVCGG